MSRQYLLKPDSLDARDKLFAPSTIVDLAKVPKMSDLSVKMSPIVDQGQLGSCTGNAIAGLLEYRMLAAGMPLNQVSRLFIYWWERYMEGTVNEDAGAMIRTGMQVAKLLGAPPESVWPYIIEAFMNEPDPKSIITALQTIKLTQYSRITSLDSVRMSLAEGNPVVAGIYVYDSFESQAVAQNGMVPVPNKATEKCLGGHAVLFCGHNDDKRLVKVRNSWGAEWGDKGYFYLPYDFFTQGFVTDMWTGK